MELNLEQLIVEKKKKEYDKKMQIYLNTKINIRNYFNLLIYIIFSITSLLFLSKQFLKFIPIYENIVIFIIFFSIIVYFYIIYILVRRIILNFDNLLEKGNYKTNIKLIFNIYFTRILFIIFIISFILYILYHFFRHYLYYPFLIVNLIIIFIAIKFVFLFLGSKNNIIDEEFKEKIS